MIKVNRHRTAHVPKARERIDVFVRTWCLLATCEMQPLCHVNYRATGGCVGPAEEHLLSRPTRQFTRCVWAIRGPFSYGYMHPLHSSLLFASAVPAPSYRRWPVTPRPVAASSSISPWTAGYGQGRNSSQGSEPTRIEKSCTPGG